MSKESYTQKQEKLDGLFKTVATFKGDQEVFSLLTRYLCILVSGYIEASVRDIVCGYVQVTSHKNVANFVANRLKHLTNLKMENILQLIGSFNPVWRVSVEKAVDEELRDAINSVVNNRNNIAHGVDVNLRFSEINDYYAKTVKVMKILEKSCC